MLVASAETAPLTQPREHGLDRAKALSPQGDKGKDAMELEKTELTGIAVTARGPQPRTLGPEVQGLQTRTVLGDMGTNPMEIDDIDPGGDVGAGVDIHNVDTRPSLFQFRNQFLVRFVPNKLPLPCADQTVLNDM